MDDKERLLNVLEEYKNDENWFWTQPFEDQADLQDFMQWLSAQLSKGGKP